MGDGKDRSRIEAVLNRSEFDIADIKDVVDRIYNGEPPTPGPQPEPGPGPEPTPQEDDFVKVATKTIDVAEDLNYYTSQGEFRNNVLSNIAMKMYNAIADSITYDDFSRSLISVKSDIMTTADEHIYGSTQLLPFSANSLPNSYNNEGDGERFSLGYYESGVALSYVNGNVDVKVAGLELYTGTGSNPFKEAYLSELFISGLAFVNASSSPSHAITSGTFTIEVFVLGEPSTGDKLSTIAYFDQSEFLPYDDGK